MHNAAVDRKNTSTRCGECRDAKALPGDVPDRVDCDVTGGRGGHIDSTFCCYVPDRCDVDVSDVMARSDAARDQTAVHDNVAVRDNRRGSGDNGAQELVDLNSGRNRATIDLDVAVRADLNVASIRDTAQDPEGPRWKGRKTRECRSIDDDVAGRGDRNISGVEHLTGYPGKAIGRRVAHCVDGNVSAAGHDGLNTVSCACVRECTAGVDRGIAVTVDGRLDNVLSANRRNRLECAEVQIDRRVRIGGREIHGVECARWRDVLYQRVNVERIDPWPVRINACRNVSRASRGST